jgi:hypothetical protein
MFNNLKENLSEESEHSSFLTDKTKAQKSPYGECKVCRDIGTGFHYGGIFNPRIFLHKFNINISD